MTNIDPKTMEKGISYEAYMELMQQLTEENKTTGEKQTEALINFTALNTKRMNRLNRTIKLQEETIKLLSEIEEPVTILVLTESWCGDAAQVLPTLNKMARHMPNATLRLLMRDENPALMDAFLTNGARSIPKVIIVNERNREVIGTWGPRPSELQNMAMENKAEREKESDAEKKKALYDVFNVVLQKWYNTDKGKSTQKEFLQVLSDAVKALEV